MIDNETEASRLSDHLQHDHPLEPIFPTFDYDEIRAQPRTVTAIHMSVLLAAETDAHYATKDKLDEMRKERDAARAELAKIAGVLGRSRAEARKVREERDALRDEVERLRSYEFTSY